jgi:hypothetical protein
MSKYKTFIKTMDNKNRNYQYSNGFHTVGSIVLQSTNKYHEYFKQSGTNMNWRRISSTKSPIEEREYIEIHINIDSIDDIIELLDTYPSKPNIDYNINLSGLRKIYEPLKELNNMIGMKKLKREITEQMLYFIQDLQTSDGDFMHTCIYGPPGTGKTEVAKLIGSIYKELNILKKGTFTKVTRADLIAGYLGQTAIKTRKVIEESLGGVLFIDEAYALGNSEKRDSFSKECIDILCECLSNHKNELMVIIAGYEEDLEKCFFSYNKGLESRFTWRFNTEKYSPDELCAIFIKKIKDAGWSYNEKDIKSSWFDENKESFENYGRDMETLFSKVKISHGKRVFCLGLDYKKVITIDDLDNGFQKFMEHKRKKQDIEIMSTSIQQMYL